MAARIDNGRVQLLTRTGLDWTDKYPSAVAALANLNVKTAYLDGELCGVDDAGLPSFARTQAATDGERDVRLVYYPFDLLHLADWNVSKLPLIERKALLEPLVANKPGLQFNGHDTGDGELTLKHAGKLDAKIQRPPGVLGVKQEGPMTELYVFRGTTGHAEMVTDDKSGKKLPPHSFGEWVFSRTINVAGETHLRGGVNCAQVLANVVKDGFHHWPELESDCPRTAAR
jgi:hypothetical protein